VGLDTKLLEKSKVFFKLNILYTLLFILFIAVPSYFYMQLQIKQYHIEQERLMQEYAQKIYHILMNVSKNHQNSFEFPQSFLFHVQLLDASQNIVFQSSNFKENKNFLKTQMSVRHNVFNIHSIVVFKEYSLKEIYLKVLILAISISLFIFTFIYLIIKASIDPYKKANEYLDAFFNDCLHELKTPLGVIQLNLEILDEKQPKTKEIQRSINATKNLFLIYEDIEYLIKHKNVNYNKEKVDFSTLLFQRIDQFESLALTKQLHFDLKIEEKIFLNINRIQLQRVIDNTLSNAIKYSYKNSLIRVTLEQNNQQAFFKVHNMGEPIARKKEIFNRYYKEDSIKGGFGIGLNIVKNICDENHISIEVDSQKNSGTTFKYTFLK
jgi:signal transduction histidine kinase